MMHPLWILLLGTAVVVLGIVRLRMGAFFALMLAAFLVSFLAPGELADKIPRVVAALGTAAGKLALIIASAAVIGQCMTDSGAADRIVRAALRAFGAKRAPAALMSSGFVLSVPVFFDTVFYLLVPLARSLHRSTRSHYLLYILAIASGAAVTHTLVPPTPGPLAVAEALSVPVGMMMLMGLIVGLPCSLLGLAMAHWMQRRFDLPMRPLPGTGSDLEKPPIPDEALPGLFASLLPIVLPVVLMASGTVVAMLARTVPATHWLHALQRLTGVLGDPNAALLLAAAVAAVVYVGHARPGREKWGRDVELAVMSAGTIILITAAGGAFGAMLKEAGVGAAIQTLFTGGKPAGGMLLLLIGWLIASLLKISQGSTTVAMITAAGMMAAMIEAQPLPFHPVYLALAIGFGGLCIVWMNDSGFWIIARMSGLTEMEVLKTWTVTLICISVFGLLLTALLAWFMPMTA
jgi:GntP family gluconate:H+ symporter